MNLIIGLAYSEMGNEAVPGTIMAIVIGSAFLVLFLNRLSMRRQRNLFTKQWREASVVEQLPMIAEAYTKRQFETFGRDQWRALFEQLEDEYDCNRLQVQPHQLPRARAQERALQRGIKVAFADNARAIQEKIALFDKIKKEQLLMSDLPDNP